MNSKIFMSLFVDIFEHNSFKLEDFLIDEISYFWKLEDDCNTHKKIFLIVLGIVVCSIVMMFFEKKDGCANIWLYLQVWRKNFFL